MELHGDEADMNETKDSIPLSAQHQKENIV